MRSNVDVGWRIVTLEQRSKNLLGCKLTTSNLRATLRTTVVSGKSIVALEGFAHVCGAEERLATHSDLARCDQYEVSSRVYFMFFSKWRSDITYARYHYMLLGLQSREDGWLKPPIII